MDFPSMGKRRVARCGLGVLLLSTIGLLVLYHTDTSSYIIRLVQHPHSGFSSKMTPTGPGPALRLSNYPFTNTTGPGAALRMSNYPFTNTTGPGAALRMSNYPFTNTTGPGAALRMSNYPFTNTTGPGPALRMSNYPFTNTTGPGPALRLSNYPFTNNVSALPTTANSCLTARLNESPLPVDLSYFSHCHQTSVRSSTREKKTSIDKNKKIILFHNPPVWYPSEKSSITRSQCKVAACEMTSNRRRLAEADAVVFHTCELFDRKPLARTSPRQIWVAFGLESPYNYAGQYKAPEWRDVFNWTMGYRLDSDIFTPYSFMKLRPPPAGKNYTAIALAKKRPVAWFVSHCRVQSLRDSYVKRLQQYIDVDIYGNCGTLSCPRDNSEGACYTNYYFYLSFENSICKYYVTEKFFKLFRDINVIPVVRGGFDYNKFFDQRTFVNTADFGSPKQLANHLLRLMNDVEAYTSMLKAKDLYHVDNVSTLDTGFCDLCERLQRPDIQHRVYPDHWDWVTRNTCRPPTDLTVS